MRVCDTMIEEKNNLKLSIIVPVYNAETYISECVDMLLSQTYPNKEIIFIDDGSKDKSGELLDEQANQHSDIVVIHQKNAGAPAARNTGLRAATGDLIAFCDVDDGVDLYCYDILVDVLMKTESDVSSCGYITEYSGNVNIRKVKPDSWNVSVVEGTTKCLEQISAKENGLAGFVWNKVYKKSLIGDLLFDESVAIIDDLVFTYHCLSKAKKACSVNLPMYHYRYVASSISKKPNMAKFMNCLNSFQHLNKWIGENAPTCLPAASVNFIFWNTKAAETMLNNVDMGVYGKIKENIQSNKGYLPNCSTRVKLLANCLLKSWPLYWFVGGIIWNMKRLYVTLKRCRG